MCVFAFYPKINRFMCSHILFKKTRKTAIRYNDETNYFKKLALTNKLYK